MVRRVQRNPDRCAQRSGCDQMAVAGVSGETAPLAKNQMRNGPTGERRVIFQHAVVRGVGDVEIAEAVDGNPAWEAQVGRAGRRAYLAAAGHSRYDGEK